MPQPDPLRNHVTPGETSLRQRLRLETRDAHVRLESHPRMRAYATGLTTADYPAVVRRLHTFWCETGPETRSLPPGYHGLLRHYRAALAADAGAVAAPAPPTQHFDEVAYFYLLLGSSHGARHMLTSARDAAGRKHLVLLAADGPALWRHFVRQVLGAVPAERMDTVLTHGRLMFDALYDEIDQKDAQ